MNNVATDPNCNTSKLNSAFFPVGSAQHLDINFKILPFLCDLLKATTDDSVSPLLTEPPTPFDLTPYTDFTELNQIGDPRVSLGETMTQTYINFLPRVIAQTEVRQNGGTQVVDGYICNSDGVPIKKSESINAILSLDLNGKNSYQYGAITVPPISATFEELMKPLESQEIIDFVNTFVNDTKNLYSEYFVDFIKKYFPNWTPTVNAYQESKFIIVELKLKDQTVYLKYYFDSANRVACLLGLDKINYYLGNQTPNNMALAIATGSIIPNYKELMSDTNKANDFLKTINSTYLSTPEKQYTSILSNSATAISYFNEMANKINTASISAVPVVQCD